MKIVDGKRVWESQDLLSLPAPKGRDILFKVQDHEHAIKLSNNGMEYKFHGHFDGSKIVVPPTMSREEFVDWFLSTERSLHPMQDVRVLPNMIYDKLFGGAE